MVPFTTALRDCGVRKAFPPPLSHQDSRREKGVGFLRGAVLVGIKSPTLPTVPLELTLAGGWTEYKCLGYHPRPTPALTTDGGWGTSDIKDITLVLGSIEVVEGHRVLSPRPMPASEAKSNFNHLMLT